MNLYSDWPEEKDDNDVSTQSFFFYLCIFKTFYLFIIIIIRSVKSDKLEISNFA